MIRFLTFFTILLYHTHSWSYRPTVDSLFRSARLGEIESSTTVMKLAFEIQDEKFYQTIVISQHLKNSYYLFTFDSKGKLIFQSLLPGSKIQHEVSKKNLFYALILSLARGETSHLYHLLSLKDIDIEPQDKFINKEKKSLLMNYRYFVKRQRDDKTLSDDESPMVSKDREKQKVIDQILASSFYPGAERAEIVKLDEVFYWQVNKKNFNAYFDLQTRKLSQVQFDCFDKPYILFASSYKVFSGQREFPAVLTIMDEGTKFTVSVESYYHRDYTSSQLDKFLKGFGEVQDQVGEEKKLLLSQLLYL